MHIEKSFPNQNGKAKHLNYLYAGTIASSDLRATAGGIISGKRVMTETEIYIRSLKIIDRRL